MRRSSPRPFAGATSVGILSVNGEEDVHLHSGERSELLLAFDSSLTCRFAFGRVPDFVEVRQCGLR